LNTNAKIDKVYELKEPIAWGSETVSKLEFRKPQIGDIKFMKLTEPTLDDILRLASKLSGQSQQLIDSLSIQDGMEVADLLGNYLGPSPETGKVP
jgi:hypothetical protein